MEQNSIKSIKNNTTRVAESGKWRVERKLEMLPEKEKMSKTKL